MIYYALFYLPKLASRPRRPPSEQSLIVNLSGDLLLQYLLLIDKWSQCGVSPSCWRVRGVASPGWVLALLWDTTQIFILECSVFLWHMHFERGGVFTHGRTEVTFDFLTEMCLDMILHVVFPSLNFLANLALENVKSIGVENLCYEAVICIGI